ncbi:MAG TPA: 16S rRNA (uracil(1498)-N(3))-methyltransferase [Rhodanobacteraceae bacterium]|nr:16S rRNA (uracil(1498)-N(3))-methyltransferase [Rhodanobacteraceae bacterium]
MRRIRLHVALPLAIGAEVELPADAAVHAINVLRLAVGDAITLFNGDGTEYEATLLTATKKQAVAQIDQAHENAAESPQQVCLAQALARGDKMDWIIQKATELGVTRVQPLVTERSEVRLDGARAEKRLAHWQMVAVAASEQCGRARVPQILAAQPLAPWCAALADDGAMRLALLPGATHRLRDLALPPAGAVLVVGPEGGFGARDQGVLKDAGFVPLGLGPRVLRTETAGLAALAALQALHGDA